MAAITTALPPKAFAMERDGDATKTGVTDACRAHLADAETLDIRQTRRGFCQELLGCEAKTEFNYFNKDATKIAHSIEDTNCLCRICCGSMHPFTMRVNEVGTEAELLTVERPCACPASGCKCCCYQTARYTSGGNVLATIKETCYFCVPSFKIFDASGTQLYLVHPPTCCGGMCMNCCTEGNPCGKGCCMVPFWIYDAAATQTNGGQAEHLGKILKKPKSVAVEIFTDASAFEVNFPATSTVEQKAALVGTAIFLNAVFFEGTE